MGCIQLIINLKNLFIFNKKKGKQVNMVEIKKCRDINDF